MKTYAEVITKEAQRVCKAWVTDRTYLPTNAGVISFIYGVEERDVDIDIDDEFIKMLDNDAE